MIDKLDPVQKEKFLATIAEHMAKPETRDAMAEEIRGMAAKSVKILHEFDEIKSLLLSTDKILDGDKNFKDVERLAPAWGILREVCMHPG